MEALLNSILRRFKLLIIKYRKGILDATDPLYIELSNIPEREVNNFTALIKKYIQDQSEYTLEIIRQELLEVGYSDALIDNLIDIPKINTQIATEDDKLHDPYTEIDLSDNIEIPEDDPEMISDSISMEDETENILFVADTNFVWRPNQCMAINNTIDQDFKSGIQHQYMGTGKTYIILKTIAEHYKSKQLPMIYLLLCDRQEILRKMWFGDEGKLSQEKKLEWKRNQIIDLDKFKFMEFVKTKDENIIERINARRSKPSIMI